MDSTLYARAEGATRDCLIKASRIRARREGVRCIRPEPMQSGSHDKTAPNDSLCYLLDVEKLLRELDSPSSRAFVHVSASVILVGSLVQGMTKRDITIQTGVRGRQQDAILEGAVVTFFTESLTRGLPLAFEDYRCGATRASCRLCGSPHSGGEHVSPCRCAG